MIVIHKHRLPLGGPMPVPGRRVVFAGYQHAMDYPKVEDPYVWTEVDTTRPEQLLHLIALPTGGYVAPGFTHVCSFSNNKPRPETLVWHLYQDRDEDKLR